jgi:hypothetical protein
MLLIENLCPRIGILDLKRTIKIPNSRSLCESTEIVKLRNTNQILDPEYPITNSYIAELIVNVVDGESMDDNKTHCLASTGTFCLFVE